MRLFLELNGPGRKFAKFQNTETIFVQGDPGQNVFYIHEGRIKLTVVNSAGKEAVLEILGPGDFLGLRCLGLPSVYTSTATAIVPTTVLVIEKDVMIRVLREERELSNCFIENMLAKDARGEEALIDHLFNSIEKRLARTLLLLARYGKDAQPRKVLPGVSQEMLAEMIGASRPRVNYFMIKFRKLGFIEYEGYNGEIHVNQSLLSVVLQD